MSVQNKLSKIAKLLSQVQQDVLILPERPILGSQFEDYPKEYFSHSWWGCEDSPTGNCMYTTDLDCCIFCYQPNERK